MRPMRRRSQHSARISPASFAAVHCELQTCHPSRRRVVEASAEPSFMYFTHTSCHAQSRFCRERIHVRSRSEFR
jgi:hypothetical protein